MKTKLWTDLSDAQSETVVGGLGRLKVEGGTVADSAGFYGWFGGPNHMDPADHKGVINAGFTAPGVFKELPNGGVVVVPGSK